MWRLTLGGAGMAGFPRGYAGGSIKLLFSQPTSSRPLRRTYTVRQQSAKTIDIDVVRHAHGGPAARWAEQATIGDRIAASGPATPKRLNHDADWFLLTGDMPALPAIGAAIEALPSNARGRAIIEVIDRADIYPPDAPPGLQIEWLINPNPGQQTNLLVDAVRQMIWPPGMPSVWAACEFRAMRALKTHLRDERKVNRARLYIASYWQLGQPEVG
tara:strand:+ start:16822 stop:17466 length:645 start_codon:yes stop_codon:yes gene_type:complete